MDDPWEEVGDGLERYRVRVLREAQRDAAFREFFREPDDARELAFWLWHYDRIGAWPPDTPDRRRAAEALGIEIGPADEGPLYGIEFSGVRGERRPPIVVLFYTEEAARSVFIVAVVTGDRFRRLGADVWELAADRGAEHRANRERRVRP